MFFPLYLQLYREEKIDLSKVVGDEWMRYVMYQNSRARSNKRSSVIERIIISLYIEYYLVT